MKNSPLVSIITPCYNMSHCVSRLFDSIIAQDYRPLEYILVNDGSTDDIEKLVKEYDPKFYAAGITFIYRSQENKGLAGAINAGLELLTGEYFIWPDADDYLEPGSISSCVAVLEKNTDCAIVTGQAYVRDYQHLDIYKTILKENNRNPDTRIQFEQMLNGRALFCSGCHMIRTKHFDAVNQNRQIYPTKRGQNWQLLLPLYFKYKRAFIDQPVYNYINYPNSMSKNRDDLEFALARFDEHKKILQNTLKMIEAVQQVDLHDYDLFLDDKYAKLKMESCIRYNNPAGFIDEFRKKQTDVGLDFNDIFNYLRCKSVLFRKMVSLPFRLIKGYYPSASGEFLDHKLSTAVSQKAHSYPKVAVLVPVYNGAKFLPQCFDCLLNQRYDNIEIIVVNDGSTDNTEDILVEYEEVFRSRGYTYLHIQQENARLAVAMNNAMKYVTAKYIMIYEVDDILYRDAISDKVNFLEHHNDMMMVRNNGYYIGSFTELGKRLFVNSNIRQEEQNLFLRLVNGKSNNWPASYLIRTEYFFQKLGPEHKIFEHPGGCHLQFMMTASYDCKVGFINKPLMNYYAHIDSDSHKGGIKASINRTYQYEEIRSEMVNRLVNRPDERSFCLTTIRNLYDSARLNYALAEMDFSLYEVSADQLKWSKYKKAFIWNAHKFKLHLPFQFVRKVFLVFLRKIRNISFNIRYLKRCSRSYR